MAQKSFKTPLRNMNTPIKIQKDKENQFEFPIFQVFDANVVIKELKVMGGGLAGRKSLGRLGVMSELEIRSLSVQRCDRATNCGDCVALQVRFLSNFY